MQRCQACWFSLRGRRFEGFDTPVEAELFYFAGWFKLGSGRLNMASRLLPAQVASEPWQAWSTVHTSENPETPTSAT